MHAWDVTVVATTGSTNADLADLARQGAAGGTVLVAAHQTAGNLLRTLPWTLARDLGAAAWVLARERSSLGAYGWLWRHRRAIAERARRIRAGRTVTVERWFAIDGEPL